MLSLQLVSFFFFFNDTATTEIYTLSLHDALPIFLHNYRNDLPAFALYARTDARLAYDIVQKLDLVRLAFARSQLAGMTPDRVAASIASFDLDRKSVV